MKPVGTNLLGTHDVSDRQFAHRAETQPERRTAPFVELTDVRGGAGVDPILLTGLAADDLEIALDCELRPLGRRQPVTQKAQRPALRSALGAVVDEESSYGSDARAFAGPRRRQAQRDAADHPPTSLGKNTVSSAVG